MKKIFLIQIFLTILFYNGWSQTVKENNTTYSQNITLDTIIKPDFYKIVIGVSQYTIYTGKGRHSTEIFVSLDSAKQILFTNLKIFGITDSIKLIQISEQNSNSYYSNKKILNFFEFNYYATDSIETIFNFFNEMYKSNNSFSFYATPEILQSTIDDVKQQIEKNGLEKIKRDAQLFADSNNLKIKKIENYYISNSTTVTNYNDYQVGINISMSNPSLKFYIQYIFSLE